MADDCRKMRTSVLASGLRSPTRIPHPSPAMPSHILRHFDESLEHLRSSVLMMASLTERNLANAMTGLFERDSDRANNAIADDEEIDQLEKQVDKEGYEILIRFQPVAVDFRHVIATMRLSNNLERIGDAATSIARRVKKLNAHAVLTEAKLLEPMYREAVAMLKDSLRAFVDGDLELAKALKPRDKQLDAMNKDIADQLTEAMPKMPDQLRGYLNLIFIARSLERVGDHATNIAEDAIFAKSAQDVRHVRAGE